MSKISLCLQTTCITIVHLEEQIKAKTCTRQHFLEAHSAPVHPPAQIMHFENYKIIDKIIDV